MREQIRLEQAKTLWEDGLSPEEIAEEMGVKIKTVKVYMSMLGLGYGNPYEKAERAEKERFVKEWLMATGKINKVIEKEKQAI